MNNYFGFKFKTTPSERQVELTSRWLGIDFSLIACGYLEDWVFPFMFVPSLRGAYLQAWFLGIFIGRLREVPK